MELETFKDFINEVTGKLYPVTYSNSIGYFKIEGKDYEEFYEIEFDKIPDAHNIIIGMKFFRVIDGKRLIRYTPSKEPLSVAITIKNELLRYIEKYNPDIFGFAGDLDETGRLRHYQKMLGDVSRKYKQYNHSFTEDKGGQRLFVISNKSADDVSLNLSIDNLRKKLNT